MVSRLYRVCGVSLRCRAGSPNPAVRHSTVKFFSAQGISSHTKAYQAIPRHIKAYEGIRPTAFSHQVSQLSTLNCPTPPCHFIRTQADPTGTNRTQVEP